MKLESDFSVLVDKSAPQHPAYPAFVKAMDGRAYGYEALNDAWGWYRKGWKDGMVRARQIVQTASAPTEAEFERCDFVTLGVRCELAKGHPIDQPHSAAPESVIVAMQSRTDCGAQTLIPLAAAVVDAAIEYVRDCDAIETESNAETLACLDQLTTAVHAYERERGR